jgi:hypothetical protein
MNLDGGNLETLFEINNQTTLIGGFVGWAGPVGTINYCEKTDRVFFIASRSSTAEFRRLCSVNYQNLDLQFHASGQHVVRFDRARLPHGLRIRGDGRNVHGLVRVPKRGSFSPRLDHNSTRTRVECLSKAAGRFKPSVGCFYARLDGVLANNFDAPELGELPQNPAQLVFRIRRFDNLCQIGVLLSVQFRAKRDVQSAVSHQEADAGFHRCLSVQRLGKYASILPIRPVKSCPVSHKCQAQKRTPPGRLSWRGSQRALSMTRQGPGKV